LFFAEKEGDEARVPEGVKSHKTSTLSQYLQAGKRNIIMKQTNKPELKAIRQSLRTNGTPAEATLWRILKNKQFDGWRWRRQYSVGNIIIDFYCPKAKLGIELDGNHHFESGGQIADEIKTEILHEFGIKIIHIENKTLWDTPDFVLETIRQELNSTPTN
jgi:very-short-patch-repair endonuclease